ncbi:hypothetical protein ACK378_19760, partial [Aeromonas veronii]
AFTLLRFYAFTLLRFYAFTLLRFYAFTLSSCKAVTLYGRAGIAITRESHDRLYVVISCLGSLLPELAAPSF